MDLKTALKERGLTDQQLTAKAVTVMEQMLAEDCCGVTTVETAKALVEEVKEAQRSIKHDISYANRGIESLSNYIKQFENRIARMDEKVSAYEESKKAEIIDDEKLLDTLNFYTALLQRTQNVFGAEKMTETVIVQLLETASYGVWRSIMGGKFPER